MSPRGRYAPSPTGALHLGNARTALVAWLRARNTGSTFVMRVEDLDEARSKAEHVHGNLAELGWLGIDWDEGPDVGGPHAPYVQSERHALYEAALASLASSASLFECFLSRSDLRDLASAPHGRPVVYGARERRQNERVKAVKRAEGKEPAIRFRAPAGEVSFTDLIHGVRSANPETEIGDIVVRRADRVWSYQLAVVVDDLAMGIEEVVRGDDLLDSTAAQVSLSHALGGQPPSYIHVPLLNDVDGERMAKRKGSLTLAALQDAGIGSERVVGLLAYTLGLLAEPAPTAAETLIDDFELASLHSAPYTLSETDLAYLYR